MTAGTKTGGSGQRLAALAWVALSAALVTGSCSYSGGLTAPYRPPEIVPEHANRGKTLYQRDCAWCHAADGSGTERGPNLLTGQNGPAYTDFMLSSGRMPIEQPTSAVKRSDPSYTRAEIDDIVDYVTSLGADGPEIPDPNPAEGEFGIGIDLYIANCAPCHSVTAIGYPLATEAGPIQRTVIAPGLKDSSPREVAEAMLVGPGNMPVFGPDTFTEEEVDSIVKYTEYLKAPSNRGGHPLGLVGPVAEGAVGWLIGLALLLAVVRWIGTRANEI